MAEKPRLRERLKAQAAKGNKTVNVDVEEALNELDLMEKMMAEETKSKAPGEYTVEIDFRVTHRGKEIMSSPLKYSGMDYDNVVMVESVLLPTVLEKLTGLGMAKASDPEKIRAAIASTTAP